MSPHPKHQNMPLWARSGVPSSPPSFRTPESAHVGTFWCLRTSPLPSLSRTPEHARTGTFWCSRTSALPLPCLEHQNKPTRACSDVRAPLPVSTTRTCPHGLILVLGHLSSPSPS